MELQVFIKALFRSNYCNSIKADTIQSWFEVGQSLYIGAATVLNEIKKSPVVQERAPALAEAIGVLASNPIRNRATISRKYNK